MTTIKMGVSGAPELCELQKIQKLYSVVPLVVKGLVKLTSAQHPSNLSPTNKPVKPIGFFQQKQESAVYES